MKHFNVFFKSDGKGISAAAGTTILEAANQAGIILDSVCGGKGKCGKCRVILEPDGRSVLACQHVIETDLVVTVPVQSRFYEQKILTEGIDRRADITPDLYKKYAGCKTTGTILGIAVDIGTTTVVAKLVDMVNGQSLATQAAMNPQSRYGDDVISRISYGETEAGLNKLHDVIIDCINRLISVLCAENSISANHIYEMCVVGNTTMNHLFLRLPVRQLGQAPYKAFLLDAYDVPAEKLGVNINPAGNIHTVENIAGFVGSDTVAVVLAADIDSAKQLTLAVDIGTNGEIVLAVEGKLLAASCAAGPAFEGARISCGSRAVEGAIENVARSGNDIDLSVIGNCPPRSICGSGLIDAVAVMLDLGIIDASGRFAEQGSPFNLNRAAGAGEQLISLTQRDIREVQLAKAAIRAGIKILQQKTGIEDGQIERILLAGAFGNYIRTESAMRIGLLPRVPVERIHFIGNAAVSGAWMILISSQCRAKAKELARKIEYVEIARQANFQDLFADSIVFDI